MRDGYWVQLAKATSTTIPSSTKDSDLEKEEEEGGGEEETVDWRRHLRKSQLLLRRFRLFPMCLRQS